MAQEQMGEAGEVISEAYKASVVNSARKLAKNEDILDPLVGRKILTEACRDWEVGLVYMQLVEGGDTMAKKEWLKRILFTAQGYDSGEMCFAN